MQGNKIAAHAALNAGATNFFGYPITPSSEVFETWVQLCGDPENPNKSPVTEDKLQYLQCEDEMSSGFTMIGSCLAGKKAFTATAGPGNVLMQDAFSAAEALRIPTVAIIVQRGGLSTSTVIYSQEEVTLTCYGGNGEGFRVVYSPSTLQEYYKYTMKSFNTAWKYRYPTFVLADGYQGKMEGEIELRKMDQEDYIEPKPILLGEERQKGISTNLRNCYDQEEEINEVIEQYRKDYITDSKKLAESKSYKTRGSETIIIAHGIVATAARKAVDLLREDGIKVGLWRPITLRPLDKERLIKTLRGRKRIIFVESALGQLARLVNDALMYGLFGHSDTNTGTQENVRMKRNVRIELAQNLNIETLFYPAIGINPEDIVKFVKSKEKNEKKKK